MKSFIIGFLILIALLGFLNLVKNKTEKIKVGETTINVEVADTVKKQLTGLSYRKSLPKDNGMLFVFPEEARYGFWMKDMNFPLDIAWIDKNKKIVLIKKNLSPDTYPKIFGTSTLSKFVLETNADFFDSHNINVGDRLEIKDL